MSCAYFASPKVLRECCRLTIPTGYSLYAGGAKKFPQSKSVCHPKQVILSH
jgi:hypothetical protein